MILKWFGMRTRSESSRLILTASFAASHWNVRRRLLRGITITLPVPFVEQYIKHATSPTVSTKVDTCFKCCYTTCEVITLFSSLSLSVATGAHVLASAPICSDILFLNFPLLDLFTLLWFFISLKISTKINLYCTLSTIVCYCNDKWIILFQVMTVIWWCRPYASVTVVSMSFQTASRDIKVSPSDV